MMYFAPVYLIDVGYGTRLHKTYVYKMLRVSPVLMITEICIKFSRIQSEENADVPPKKLQSLMT